MGTHPIFESDFDCLTDCKKGTKKMLGAKATHLPLFIRGTVVKGFGRGSKELGCPTANFSEAVVDKLPKDLPNGIYFGLAQVDGGAVHKMVLSMGWNPFYGNTKKSFETHIIHQFDDDFYDSELIVVMLGYLRPEKNFDSLEALKDAIWSDVDNAKVELDREEFVEYRTHDIFINPNNNSLSLSLYYSLITHIQTLFYPLIIYFRFLAYQLLFTIYKGSSLFWGSISNYFRFDTFH